MSRIVVIGSSGSGKSTLSEKLAEKLEISRVQLDAINWLPNWVERDADEFLRLVDQNTPPDGSWVVDGNYSRIRHVVWPRAQFIVWLNYPFHIVFWRIVKRTTARVFNQTELFSGNRETFKKAFLSTDSMILWFLKTYHRRRRQYRAAVNSEEYKHVQFLELNHPSQSDELLNQLDVFTEVS